MKIYDVGLFVNRFYRIMNAPKRVFEKAKRVDADIYHLHDPELIPIGLKLKRLGKKVIFDSHEDVPKQMLSKTYLNSWSRWLISKILKFYEVWSCSKFSGIIAATPFIRDKFLKINSNTVDINNFPILNELGRTSSCGFKKKEVCYIGVISKARGILQVVEALGLVGNKISLNLCGLFSERETEKHARKCGGWEKVNAHGSVNRQGVREVLSRSMAGIVTFFPAPNHLDAQPNKMFEYMSAGIPVIASNFPLWKEIVEVNCCGICVDPLDPRDIARAIKYLTDNPKEAKVMGENGRRLVKEKYNWSTEEKKLIDLYNKILDN